MKKKVKREARRHKHKNKRRKIEDLPASMETDKDVRMSLNLIFKIRHKYRFRRADEWKIITKC